MSLDSQDHVELELTYRRWDPNQSFGMELYLKNKIKELEENISANNEKDCESKKPKFKLIFSFLFFLFSEYHFFFHFGLLALFLFCVLLLLLLLL